MHTAKIRCRLASLPDQLETAPLQVWTAQSQLPKPRTSRQHQSGPQQPHENVPLLELCSSRRAVLLSGLALGGLASGVQPAQANPVQDLIVRQARPELEKDQAIVMLMDAKSTLTELSKLAATPPDSQERFRARSILPGMAKRLREVGPAAPVVAAAVSGNLREAGVSKRYGGQAGLQGATDAVYQGIGSVITISGRTIRKEAQASPDRADEAIRHIDDLLSQLPAADTAKATAFRKARQLLPIG